MAADDAETLDALTTVPLSQTPSLEWYFENPNASVQSDDILTVPAHFALRYSCYPSFGVRTYDCGSGQALQVDVYVGSFVSDNTIKGWISWGDGSHEPFDIAPNELFLGRTHNYDVAGTYEVRIAGSYNCPAEGQHGYEYEKEISIGDSFCQAKREVLPVVTNTVQTSIETISEIYYVPFAARREVRGRNWALNDNGDRVTTFPTVCVVNADGEWRRRNRGCSIRDRDEIRIDDIYRVYSDWYSTSRRKRYYESDGQTSDFTIDGNPTVNINHVHCL